MVDTSSVLRVSVRAFCHFLVDENFAKSEGNWLKMCLILCVEGQGQTVYIPMLLNEMAYNNLQCACLPAPNITRLMGHLLLVAQQLLMGFLGVT